MRYGSQTETRPHRAGRGVGRRIWLSSTLRHQQLLPADHDPGSRSGHCSACRGTSCPATAASYRSATPRSSGSAPMSSHSHCLLEPDALGGNSARHDRRRHRRGPDRPADLPPEGPLLRAVDARLPAGDPVLPAIPRLPGNVVADAPGHPAAFLEFTNPHYYTLVAVCFLIAGVFVCMLVENSRFGLALAGDPAERTGGRGSRHQRPSVEDARPGRFRHDRRRGRRLLRLRAAGGHPGFSVRHAGVRPGGRRDAVRRRRLDLGAGHRRCHPGAAGRIPERRTRQYPAGHPGRGVRRAPSSASCWPRPTGLFWTIRDRFFTPKAPAPLPESALAANAPPITHPAAERNATADGHQPVENLRRPARRQQRQLRGQRRRNPRHHRPQRRRQNHLVQRAQRCALRVTRAAPPWAATP